MDWINEQTTVAETEMVRHIRFSNPILLNLDGREGKAMISYPKEGDEVE